jgi:nucleotide-binding universal stress UspA family protein
VRRILVPLDGSQFSEVIIPDARRLAGPDGELVLVRQANWPLLERDLFVDTTMLAVEDAEWYLHHEAEQLRREGVNVRTQSLILADPASAIDQSVAIFQADMIAIATHGRGPLGRLLRGSVAWRALAHSPVPVLLRHVEESTPSTNGVDGPRRLMVPLDGSSYAEKALPVAEALAREWHAALWLVRVVPDFQIADTPYTRGSMISDSEEGVAVTEARDYLMGIAKSLTGEIHTQAGTGPVTDTLVHWVEHLSVTDVVMASHGLTGLPRVILGSVADELIHRLHSPIIVIPALAAREGEQPSATNLNDGGAEAGPDQMKSR